MKIRVGQKYKYGWGDGSKDKIVKVIDIRKMDDDEIYVEYETGNWPFQYTLTTQLEYFKSHIKPSIIIKHYKEYDTTENK